MVYKKCLVFIIVFFLFTTFFLKTIHAQSQYVLPYPSAMPGSIFYKVNLFSEKLLNYWYFGSFSQYTYNLKYSDKYLVEAKTLFEYKQFLLASQALLKSDEYFTKTVSTLDQAASEKKDIAQKKELLQQAALKHIEVLQKIKKETPESFVWEAENELPVELNLKNSIENSIKMREKKL